jgi:hypothetical protein
VNIHVHLDSKIPQLGVGLMGPSVGKGVEGWGWVGEVGHMGKGNMRKWKGYMGVGVGVGVKHGEGKG